MNDGLAIDSQISHYRIVSKIGAGGMGEVYRARDERLARDVAVKMLPREFAKDHDRLRRFEQEAKATSALNHPNILTVYDIGEQDGTPFIVSELLVGEELRERLNEGKISLRKSIDYAQQIVSGLSAAHERGITHRDLKPENLFITDDDRVKILDFGLAKLRESGPASHGSEDATKKALTDPGVVMGTVGYMSPEQVRGQSTDHRSDIFSFGVIFYEMLTGRRAFTGETTVETMHSIMKDDVAELEDSGIRVPPAVEKLMRRCLEKKPDHRFHSAHDLGFALEAVATPTSSTGSDLTIAARSIPDEAETTTGTSWLSKAALAAAAILLVSTGVFAWLYFSRSGASESAAAMRFTIASPGKSSLAEASSLSPDGKSIAFVARGEGGVTSLWIRPFNSVESRQLPGTDGAAYPFWSPDGRWVGYFADDKLRKVDTAGGPPQTLADATGDARGATWAPDGTILFAPNVVSPIMRVSSSGGSVTEVTKIDTNLHTSHRWPSMLPDGKHFFFFARGNVHPDKQGIYIGALDSPETRMVVTASVAGAYTEANGIGYVLFVRDGTLMAQPFNVNGQTLSGDATPLVPNVLAFPGEVGPTAYAAFSAAGGNLIYRTGDQQTTQLTWFDRSGKQLESITEPGIYHEPSLSKDGTKVLYGKNDPSGPQDIYIEDLVRGGSTRLTFDPSSDTSAVFSPDETQIMFFSNRSGSAALYRKSASGAGGEQVMRADPLGIYPDGWTRDGRFLLIERVAGPQTKIDLWIIPADGTEPYPYLETPYEEGHGQFSPDGRWIAYASMESGRVEVYLQSFPIGNGKWQISTAGGDQVQWSHDGKELFYIAPDRNLMAVSISGTSALAVGKPEALFRTNVPLVGISEDRNSFVPSPDGKRFLVNTLATESTAQPLILILNWAAELQKPARQ